MTIFPTHKTRLKTKLPRHEVLRKLENNDFYALGYDYKLEKTDSQFTLNPYRDTTIYRSINSSSPPIIAMSVEQKSDITEINLRFFPLKREIIRTSLAVALVFLIQLVILIICITQQCINYTTFIPSLAGIMVYLFCFIIFSVEVISIRKQIEEHIEAEIQEVNEDEMSKLQKWYENKK